MTTTSAKKDHRSLPRQKRAPSARDQAIFLAYRTQGRSQAKLAEENGLSQRRISQIVRRTQHWLDHGIPTLHTTPPSAYSLALPSSDRLDRQRLERRLARERDQAIFDRALHQHDHQPKALVTTVEYCSNDAPTLNLEPGTLNLPFVPVPQLPINDTSLGPLPAVEIDDALRREVAHCRLRVPVQPAHMRAQEHVFEFQ